MNTDEKFEIERDTFRKWLEKYSYDQCVSLMGDLYDIAEYKKNAEQLLGRRFFHAN